VSGDLAVMGGDLDVVVRDGRIEAVGPHLAVPAGVAELDAAGGVVVPGFVDLQCNGGFGIDLTAEPERLWELAALLPRTGVTSWLPTVVTSPPAVTERALAALARPVTQGPVAEPLGLHLEGPFLAPARRGAHDRRHLSAPDRQRIAGWSAAAGVALVTLAPELPGALELVRLLTARGVVVAAGHSDATAEESVAAIEAGVSLATHLFNAMAPLDHRQPGLAGVVLADERLRAGVIADGLHLHPTTVAAAWRALGPRLVLVTDAVAALGASAGPTRIGEQELVRGRDGVRLADGTRAGSDLSMDGAVRNLMAFAGCSLAAAAAAASSAPAAALGRTDRGRLQPGARGDIVVLAPDGQLIATVIGGQVAWKS
jgi:N-acetylglucosamine-6-phosphate deacetylase